MPEEEEKQKKKDKEKERCQDYEQQQYQPSIHSLFKRRQQIMFRISSSIDQTVLLSFKH